MASSEGKEELGGEENDRIVTELANDYSNYLHVDASVEQGHFDDEVEQLLTRLEEYCGLVDIIRSDTSLCLHRTLPEIQVKGRQMSLVFDKIDKLEAFVGVVKRDVHRTEELVNKAESEMGSLSSIKRAFNSISLPSIFTKRNLQPKTVQPTPHYAPPDIFHTETYLQPQVPTAASGNHGNRGVQPHGNSPRGDIHMRDNSVGSVSDSSQSNSSPAGGAGANTNTPDGAT